jgi:hypothetical protein
MGRLGQFLQFLALMAPLLAIFAPLTRSAAQDFGKVGAVNQEATGTPPGGETQTLAVGTNIVVKERVHTSGSGSAQILFPDQSTLNIGANSDMVVDKYYYNPNSQTGSLVATATKGVLRYVGGQISHEGDVEIKTPAATLGIRGGILTIMLPVPPNVAKSDPQLAGLKGELVISQFGTITITNSTGQTVLPNGFATVIGSNSTPIPTPFRLSDATLQIIIHDMKSGPGQTGGVTNLPTNRGAALLPGFNLSFVPDPMPAPGTDPLGYTSIFAAGTGAAKGISQGKQTQNAQTQYSALHPTSPSMPPPPPPPMHHHHPFFPHHHDHFPFFFHYHHHEAYEHRHHHEAFDYHREHHEYFDRHHHHHEGGGDAGGE